MARIQPNTRPTIRDVAAQAGEEGFAGVGVDGVGLGGGRRRAGDNKAEPAR